MSIIQMSWTRHKHFKWNFLHVIHVNIGLGPFCIKRKFMWTSKPHVVQHDKLIIYSFIKILVRIKLHIIIYNHHFLINNKWICLIYSIWCILPSCGDRCITKNLFKQGREVIWNKKKEWNVLLVNFLCSI